MKVEQFNKIVEEQLKRSTDVLVKKAGEYATEDRLHNFKVAAGLYGERPQQALAGMMAKHTVSIYDMCKNKKVYPIDMWNEKITDHINYLLLLRAIVEEEKEESDNIVYADNIVAENAIVEEKEESDNIVYADNIVAENATFRIPIFEKIYYDDVHE